MKTITILCIGDSHTAGYPDYDPFMGGDPESSYQFWLLKSLQNTTPAVKYELFNEGMCGDTSRGIVQRLLQTLTVNTYDLVILAGGTNDLSLSNGDQVFNNLKQGYEACIQNNIPVIAPAIPPLCFPDIIPQIMKVNKFIQTYASQNQCILFSNWYSALQDERGFLADSYNAGDGVHLSVAGYKRIGDVLAPLVQDLITV
jgi:lysophospholipase L1-like esterase